VITPNWFCPVRQSFRAADTTFPSQASGTSLFDPIGDPGHIIPLWRNPNLARGGTFLADLLITLLVIGVASCASAKSQRDLAFGVSITAMLLVAPVTWDISLPLLLVPIAVIAQHCTRSRSHWMLAALGLIVAIIWVPQPMLTALAEPWHRHTDFHWTFILGAPSLKFYALLGTFALGLAAQQSRSNAAATVG
jgi:hypothetical protein